MQMFIPHLGFRFRLTRPWTFTLYADRANISAWKRFVGRVYEGMRISGRWCLVPSDWEVTLPKGTELVVDRIYIRKGKNYYDSLTFRTQTKGGKARFWVKLEDARKIYYAPVEEE